MSRCQTIRDVSGHDVSMSPEFCDQHYSLYGDIKTVLTDPSYLIEISGEVLYFFKLLHWELNLMVEVRKNNAHFMVEDYTENPSPEMISTLLDRGTLISFP